MFPFLLLGAGSALAYLSLRGSHNSSDGSTLSSDGNFPSSSQASVNHSMANVARFKTFEEVSEELTRQGLESCNLIIGVDFTKSNLWTGKETFNQKSLHNLSDQEMNPYQHVISIISRSLVYFDDDQLIPVYGFGDVSTTDKHVFSFNLGDQPHFGLASIEARYRELVPCVMMSGPTSFGPIIRRGIDIAESSDKFHLLIIIADGQVASGSNEERDTINAIVEASRYALSIVVVGVGDGPWDQMEAFDNAIPQRDFDNFHFVNYHKVMRQYMHNPSTSVEAIFAMHVLMELPDQYKHIRKQNKTRHVSSIHRARQIPKNPPTRPVTNLGAASNIWSSWKSQQAFATLQQDQASSASSSSSSTQESTSFHAEPSAPPSSDVGPLLCPICQVEPVNTVFQCGHSCCRECADRLADCHMCRTRIHTRNPLFL